MLPVFRIALLVVLLVPVAPAWASDYDPVVLAHGDTLVTLTDLRRSIEQTIPEHQRGHFYAHRERLTRHAVNFFVVRKLAELAQQRELSEAEAWQVEEARMRALSQVQLDYLVETSPAQPDYEQLAYETYLAHPERFRIGESVRAEHILIGTDKRSAEEALVRAEQVLEQVQQGEDFGDLVRVYSDDPSAADNDGDLGFFHRGNMVESFAEAAFALQEPGDIAGPVRTEFGYHIIRLIDRQPPIIRPFDEVRPGIIATEKARFRERLVNRIRAEIVALADVEINREALMELYRPLPAMMQRQD